MSRLACVRGLVEEAGGAELLERLDHLDAIRRAPREAHEAPRAPVAEDAFDADVVIAGGGLWSALAPLLAARGLDVVVLERARAGQAHREWNASGPELRALVRAGLVDDAALERLVVARYDHGTCVFAGGDVHPVKGVLDHAVDAGPLLAHVRRVAEARGVRFLDGHTVLAHGAGAGVRVRARTAAGDLTLTARVLVDARGAGSPHATADLVCPTVGGVLEGLPEGDGPGEVNPRVGEILATVEGIEGGRQHVWEAFPGRPKETTIYLFYYARASEPASLVELYARFFDRLPTYKRGAPRLVRPTFGYIPGWSRLSPAPASGHPRVVLVGDAAARHSPLTYCGFGATLRSLERATDVVLARASGDIAGELAVDDAPIHALTGALAQMMAARVFRGDELNRLLDASFRTLAEAGNDAFAALLRDEMSVPAFVSFLRKTARRHPAVWGQVLRGLGPWVAGRWSFGLTRQMLAASV